MPEINKSEGELQVRSSELLDGWTLETKWVGIGQCGAGQNRVLCRGNWGVLGGTGRFRILHPDGWVIDKPTFETELEAMLWVMGKSKPSNDQAQRRPSNY